MGKSLVALVFFCLFSVASQGSGDSRLLDTNGNPTPEVLSLVRQFTPPSTHQKTSLQDINALCQSTFLRTPTAGQARVSLEPKYKALFAHLDQNGFKNAIEGFRKLGDVGAVYPTIKAPHAILIQGSTLETLRERVQFLNDLVRLKKVDVSPRTEVAILDGERPTYPEETADAFLHPPSQFSILPRLGPSRKIPSDERQVSEWVWNETALTEALKQVSISYTHTPKRSETSRATTEDCAEDWFKRHKRQSHLNPLQILIVSSSPHIFYQGEVIRWVALRNHLHNLDFDYVGPNLNSTPSQLSGTDVTEKDLKELANLLDNLARRVYVASQIQSLR